jgi:hypothetical protein
VQVQNLSVKRRWMRSIIITSRRSVGLSRALREVQRAEDVRPDLAQAMRERQQLRRLH